MTIEVLYDCDAFVAVSKPSALLVHRSSLSTDRTTLVSLLRGQLGASLLPVHRLDRATSGILLLARTSSAARILSRQFAEREVRKSYVAVVRGYTPPFGTIDYPLKETLDSDPVSACTHFTLLGSIELPHAVSPHPTSRYSLLELQPLTGRMHQIRRHMAHIRHPVIGDTTHGDGRHNQLFREKFNIKRLLLHASSLEFVHPETGSPISIEAPLPPDLQKLFNNLGW